jgi:hypothetical protein
MEEVFHRETNGRTYGQTDRQKESTTDRGARQRGMNRRTDKQRGWKNSWMEKQLDGKTARGTDRQADK